MELAIAIIGLAAAVITMFAALIVRLNQVHKLVNSRLDEALDRIDQLTQVLVNSHVTIPSKPGRHEVG